MSCRQNSNSGCGCRMSAPRSQRTEAADEAGEEAEAGTVAGAEAEAGAAAGAAAGAEAGAAAGAAGSGPGFAAVGRETTFGCRRSRGRRNAI